MASNHPTSMHKLNFSILAFLIAGSLQAATVTNLASPNSPSATLNSGEGLSVPKNGGSQITSGGAVVLVGSGSGATLDSENPTTLSGANGYVVAEGSAENPITINLPSGSITITGSAALLYDAKTGGVTLTVFSGNASVNSNGQISTLSGPHAATGNNLNALSRNLIGQPVNPRAEVRLTALLNEVNRLAGLGNRDALATSAETLRSQLISEAIANNNYMPEAFRNRMVDPSLIISQD